MTPAATICVTFSLATVAVLVVDRLVRWLANAWVAPCDEPMDDEPPYLTTLADTPTEIKP